MSFLSFLFLWVGGSCVATPLIGTLLFRILDDGVEHHSSNPIVASTPGLNKGRNALPHREAQLISRFQRRRSVALDLAQRAPRRR
jgi:hypothetical protein